MQDDFGAVQAFPVSSLMRCSDVPLSLQHPKTKTNQPNNKWHLSQTKILGEPTSSPQRCPPDGLGDGKRSKVTKDHPDVPRLTLTDDLEVGN